MASPRAYDRVRSFGGGTDKYRPASEINPDQSQDFINCIVRDNFEVRTRPGADVLKAGFAAAPVGAVQGLAFYSTFANSPGQMLMAQGGKLYSWSNTAWTGPLAFTLVNGNVAMAAAQGVDKLFISDGSKNPQIWDGANFTDSGGAGQLNAPIGATTLCFHAGRMFASGVVSSPDTIWLSNFLNFGPGNWDSANKSFRIGNGDGQAIIAIASMQNFILAVLKENSVWLVDCEPSRQPANWGAQAVGEQVGSGIGCVGANAWCLYQNDLLFMSQDGVQSLQRMQAAAGQYELSAPLSLPIQPYIDRINWTYASGIYSVKYRHLALFFVPLDNSAFNNYVLVWNGRLRQWTGVWTGWTPMAACVTRFNKIIQLVVGNNDGSVNLWKDGPTVLNSDATYLDNGVDIPTEVDLRAFTWGNVEFQKKLRAALLRFNAGNSTISFAAFLDLVDEEDWSGLVTPGGVTLPTTLPFVLASFAPADVFRSLAGLPYCDEAYLKISSTKGWWALRQVVSSAFIKKMKDDS